MANSTKWSPKSWEGSLAVDYKVEGGTLLKRTTQPDRDLILGMVRDERLHAKHTKNAQGAWGWKIATIPNIDLPRVYAKYPELDPKNGADAEQRKRAAVRFTNDREFLHLKVRSA